MLPLEPIGTLMNSQFGHTDGTPGPFTAPKRKKEVF